MLKFLQICWRDVWRNRRRSLLTGFVMVFAVAIMILFIGMGTGGHDQMIRSATDSFLGHMQIQADGFHEDPSLDRRITPETLSRIEEVLPGVERVEAWSPRISTGGLVTKKVPDPLDPEDLSAYRKMTSEGAFVVGVRPEREALVSTLVDSLVPDDPQRRCLRGCQAGLANIYVEETGHCEELCEGAGAGYGGDSCKETCGSACRDRCPEDDEFCEEADCTERCEDYCQPAHFLAVERGEGEHDVVLGSTLAQVLDVDVGDRVAITCGALRGRVYGQQYRVAGLVKTGSLDINRTFALVDLASFTAGLKAPGAATSVVMRIDHPDFATDVAEEVNGALSAAFVDGVRALGWPELSPELDVYIKLDQGGMLVMLTFIIAIVGIILANVVTMSVMERTREYGVRMALGESPNRIAWGLVFEVLLLSLAACIVGAAIGEALNFYFLHHGMDWGMGDLETTGVVLSTSDMRTQPSWYGLWLSMGTVIFFSVTGALYPAWRVRRLRPVDAIRYV